MHGNCDGIELGEPFRIGLRTLLGLLICRISTDTLFFINLIIKKLKFIYAVRAARDKRFEQRNRAIKMPWC